MWLCRAVGTLSKWRCLPPVIAVCVNESFVFGLGQKAFLAAAPVLHKEMIKKTSTKRWNGFTTKDVAVKWSKWLFPLACQAQTFADLLCCEQKC